MLKLYSYFRSSTSYRVRIALNLKGLSYETAPINLLNRAHQTPAYRAINPQGLVPTLEIVDEDTRETTYLTQSLAIIDYLEEKFPAPPLLPSDLNDRAHVRALTHMLALDVHPLNNLRVLQYLQENFKVNEDEKMKWIHRWILEGFQSVELFLQNTAPKGPFSFGPSVTLADVCLVPQVYNAERFKCDLSQFRALKRVYEACRRLPEFDKAHPDNQADSMA